MASRVSVKKVVVHDTLRFYTLYPSLQGKANAERNKRLGKYGSTQLDVGVLRADLAELKTLKAVAAKHGVNTYTVKKYLDSNYRKQYDLYRKNWRANRLAKITAARAAS